MLMLWLAGLLGPLSLLPLLLTTLSLLSSLPLAGHSGNGALICTDRKVHSKLVD